MIVDLEPLHVLEAQVEAGEETAIKARWRFGRELLPHRVGSKLPKGELARVMDEFDLGERELQRRMQFAEKCRDDESFRLVQTEYRTWSGIYESFLPTPRERPAPESVEPAEGTYPVLYADPPWRYEQPGGQTPELRAVENHYPSMSVEEICALPLPAAEDAVLFLWATNPLLREALEVMDAWDFEYRTNACWAKDRFGMGYYVRGQHELLLVGRRGQLPVPEPSNRPASVIQAPRQEHSRKPDEFYGLIEGMYPSLAKVELFARRPREGWESWGNQLAEAA